MGQRQRLTPHQARVSEVGPSGWHDARSTGPAVMAGGLRWQPAGRAGGRDRLGPGLVDGKRLRRKEAQEQDVRAPCPSAFAVRNGRAPATDAGCMACQPPRSLVITCCRRCCQSCNAGPPLTPRVTPCLSACRPCLQPPAHHATRTTSSSTRTGSGGWPAGRASRCTVAAPRPPATMPYRGAWAMAHDG